MAVAFIAVLACADRSPSTAAPLDPPAPEWGKQGSEPPERITIVAVQSAWQVSEQRLSITRTAQGFVDGERKIAEAHIQALLRAVSAPAEPALNPERWRPFIGDVRAEMESAHLSPLLAQRYSALALQPENLSQIIQRLHAFKVYDDYPSLALELAWPSGSKLTLRSESQDPLMLPWRVQGSETWNPDISAAIAALLPEHFSQRDRVAGEYLTGSISWHARELFAAQIGADGAIERFDRAIEPLRRRFRVEGASIEGRYRLNTLAHDEVWCAKLFGEPSDRFGFSLCLSAQGGLASFKPFLRDAEGLLGRARKVPWLSRFAAEHSEAQILIEYFNESSLSPYALGTVRDGMDKDYHNPELVSVADADLERSLGVTIESGKETGTWIVLPDGRGLFLYGKPFGAVEAQLESGRLIQPDGSGGVTEEERTRAARRAERQSQFEARVRGIQDSVRSSFQQQQERAKRGDLSDADRRALSAPFTAKPAAGPGGAAGSRP